MDRKAQSALEYLMTYGWALVVIVIVIAALVFLINPSNVGGNTCTGFPNLVITNSNPTVAGITVYYSNNSGQTLKDANFGGSASVGGPTVGIANTELGTISAGAKKNRLLQYTASGSTGTYTVDLNVVYRDRDNIARTETASCRGTI